MWGGLRGSLSLMYSSMHPLKGRVNRVERTLLNFFMWRGVRDGFFRVLEGHFAGDFWGGGEVWTGRFAAKFRGFLGGARVRHGDSVHGGHGRARGAKKILKTFKKKG